MGFQGIIQGWPATNGYGSRKSLAIALGIPLATVHSWYQRGSIPVKHWEVIAEAAKRRGHRVTYNTLRRAHEETT